MAKKKELWTLNLSQLASVDSLRAKLAQEPRDEPGESPAADKLSIAWTGCRAADPAFFVYLAVYVERALQTYREVEFSWYADGGGPTDECARAIRGFGLRQFIREAPRASERYKERGYEILERNLGPHSRTEAFAQLTRISSSDFSWDGDILDATPVLRHSDADRFLLQELVNGNYLPRGQVEVFHGSFFLELAWNGVLYSNRAGVGEGTCVYAVRALRDYAGNPSELRFAIGDGGRGIHDALTHLRPHGTGENFLQPDPSDTPLKVLMQLGVRPFSSRRSTTALRSAAGNRGYQHLANVALQKGSLSVYSSGVSIHLAPREKGVQLASWRPGKDWGAALDQGTVVEGSLKPLTVLDHYTQTGAIGPSWQAKASYVCGVRTGTDETIDYDHIERAVSHAASPGQRLVLDLGFVACTTSQLSGLIGAVVRLAPSSPLVVVNVAGVDEAVAQELARDLQSEKVIAPLPVLLIAPPRVVIVLSLQLKCSARIGELSSTAFEPSQPHSLSAEMLLQMITKVNSEYVAQGLMRADASGAGGFYRARVGLFSGTVVDAFFALSQNASSSEGAMTRWATSVCMALEAVADANPGARTLTLLAFAKPIEEVAARALTEVRAPSRFKRVVVRPYEAPDRSELNRFLAADDLVVLLTDARVSGGQLAAYRDAVLRCGAEVIGSIVVVDFSEKALAPETNTRALAVASVVEVEGPADLQVNPATLLPTAPSRTRSRIIENARSTAALLRAATVTYEGHLEAHGAHCSYWVNTSTLTREPKKDDEHSTATLTKLRGLIEASVNEALAGPFENFIPSATFVSTRFGPVASLLAAETEDLHHLSANQRICSVLAEVFPQWARALNDHRVHLSQQLSYDGRVTTSDGLRADGSQDGSDLLLVDDGINTGQTVRSLIGAAVRANAGRVVVIALLARLSIEDALWWLSLRELAAEHSGRALQLRVVLPLILPVPLVSREECPQERALDRLEERMAVGGSRVTSVVAAIADELHVSAVTQLSQDDPSDRSASEALYWRAMFELAAEDGRVNEGVREEAERAQEAQRFAIVRCVGREPRLTKRARLREWLGDLGQKIALSALESGRGTTTDRTHCLAYMRVALPGLFHMAVDALGRAEVVDVPLALRCAYQCFSLDAHNRADVALQNAIRRFRARSAWQASLAHDVANEELLLADFIFSEVSAIPARPHEDDAPVSLLQMIEAMEQMFETEEVHSIRSSLLAIEDAAAVAKDLSPEQMAEMREDAEAAAAVIEKRVLPIMRRAGKMFLRPLHNAFEQERAAGAQQERLALGDALTEEEGVALARAADSGSDVRGLVHGMRVAVGMAIENGTYHHERLVVGSQRAAALNRMFFHKTSVRKRLVKFLTSYSVKDCIDAVQHELVRGLPAAKPIVQLEPDVNAVLSKRVFAPRGLIERAMQAISGNIIDASMAVGRAHPKAKVIVRVRRATSGVEFVFEDNVAPPQRSRGARSAHTERLDSELGDFGGSLNTTVRLGEQKRDHGSGCVPKQALHLTITSVNEDRPV